MAKLEAVEEANNRLERDLFEKITFSEEVKTILGDDSDKLYVPLGFDNLGRSEGDTSFIDVVHTDGNGMGKRIRDFGANATSNRVWIDRMREMFKKIEEANLYALQAMTNFMASKLTKDEKGKVILKCENGKSFHLKEGKIFRDNEWKEVIFFPFRPIIFGGEDVAFICDGRIALDLTVNYLKALQDKILADGNPLFARAGVALVKTHYPFRKAYDLAEDLAKNTKERIDEIDKDSKEVYALDWHVAFTGLSGSISEIREREFEVNQDKLFMRPVSICKTKDGSDWRTWENFVSLTKEFQDKWSEKRNKAKTLREALRKGETQVEQFLKLNNDINLPEVKNCNDMKDKGWFDARCGYFDALEMMDMYFPLEEIDCSATTENSEVTA